MSVINTNIMSLILAKKNQTLNNGVVRAAALAERRYKLPRLRNLRTQLRILLVSYMIPTRYLLLAAPTLSNSLSPAQWLVRLFSQLLIPNR